MTSLAVQHARLIQVQIYTTRSFFREAGITIAEETLICLRVVVREQGRGVDAREFSLFSWNSMAFNIEYHSGFHWFWRDRHSIRPNLGMEIGRDLNVSSDPFMNIIKLYTPFLTSKLTRVTRCIQNNAPVSNSTCYWVFRDPNLHPESWIANNQTTEQRFWKPRRTFVLNGANSRLSSISAGLYSIFEALFQLLRGA